MIPIVAQNWVLVVWCPTDCSSETAAILSHTKLFTFSISPLSDLNLAPDVWGTTLTGPGQHSLLYARPWAQWSLMATPTNSPSPEQQTRTSLWNPHEVIPQVPSSIIFVKKLAQRCGVWQIKHITSPDQDQVSMKLNMFGFGVIHKWSFTKPIKQPKMDWFGLVWQGHVFHVNLWPILVAQYLLCSLCCLFQMFQNRKNLLDKEGLFWI